MERIVPAGTDRQLRARDLDALPIGSVVLDGGNKYDEHCAWTKTDDTAREARTAWAAVQWTMDRLNDELVREFGPITLLWSPGGDA